MEDFGIKKVRIVCVLNFDGTDFFGWQKQRNQISVQSVIEEKLSTLCQCSVEITGCGRTDTGVHAKHYYMHFDIPESLVDNLKIHSLNGLLPTTIAVQNIFIADQNFHSRFDANYRKYIFRIHSVKNPFDRFFSFYYPQILKTDLSKIERYCELIFRTQSFQSFVKSESGLKSFECLIQESKFIKTDDHHFEYHIAANRFIRGMVRLIVGSLLNFANDKVSLDQIADDIIRQQQITKSWSVPAIGLTLEEVKYPEDKMALLTQLRI